MTENNPKQMHVKVFTPVAVRYFLINVLKTDNELYHKKKLFFFFF